MIEHLQGTLIEKSPTKAVLSAAGVGYGVNISLATYERLPGIGETASLFVHLVVREDALTLFGFADPAEREMFLLLISVTGVGPKIALGVLSGVGLETLKANIAQGNAAALTAFPGIGRKIAERLALELKDKMGAIDGAAAAAVGGSIAVREEALAALIALGYNRPAAERAIRSALKGGPEAERNVETLIKGALKHIAS